MERVGMWLAAVVALGVGCAEEHGARGDPLASALEASAAAGRARDAARDDCLWAAGIAGAASGRGARLGWGTIERSAEGWTWSPAPADRLILTGVAAFRFDRLADDGIDCAIERVRDGGVVRVVDWRSGGDTGASVDGTTADGVELHLVHVGTVAPGDAFEAIEGSAALDGVTVAVRQTARASGAPFAVGFEQWIWDAWDGGRIDGAAIVRDADGTVTADGKALADGNTAARLVVAEGAPVWILTGGGRIVLDRAGGSL